MARPASLPRPRQAAPYQRRDPTRDVLHRLVQNHVESFLSENENVRDPKRGYLRPEVRATFESYLQCGVLGFGLALHKCDRCEQSRFVALSCRRRGICSRCRAKTLAIWSEWLDTEVLPRVPYRQWVLTLPKRIRQLFRFDASLNKRLSRILYRVICAFVRARTGRDDLEVAFIACDQREARRVKLPAL